MADESNSPDDAAAEPPVDGGGASVGEREGRTERARHLAEKEERLKQREEGLDQRAENLTERADKLDDREAELLDRRDQLAQLEEDLDAREAEIAQREDALDDRETALQERKQELDERADELDRKEHTLQTYVGAQVAEIEDSIADTVEEAVSAARDGYTDSNSSGRLGTIGNLLLALVGITLIVGGVANGFATVLTGLPALFASDAGNFGACAVLIFSGLATNLAAAAGRV